VIWSELAELGSATVHEAAARAPVVDVPLVQIVPGSRAAGPARTVRCGQGDNLMVHAAIAEAEPGEVLVLTMPEPAPVALVGELLATQALGRGVAALLVDAAVRDVEELRELGLPVWARFVRVNGARSRRAARSATRSRSAARRSARATASCSTRTARSSSRASASTRCFVAARARAERERTKRAQLQAGALSFDLDDLRALLEE
jgi:Demethylmenaquinone methyltransferase